MVCKLKGNSYIVRSLSFHPNGILLACGSLDNIIKLWDVKLKNIVNTFLGHSDQITKVKFFPDGEFLGSCSID